MEHVTKITLTCFVSVHLHDVKTVLTTNTMRNIDRKCYTREYILDEMLNIAILLHTNNKYIKMDMLHNIFHITIFMVQSVNGSQC